MTGVLNRSSTSKLQRSPFGVCALHQMGWNGLPDIISEWHLDRYDLFVERPHQVTGAWQLLPSFFFFFKIKKEKKQQSLMYLKDIRESNGQWRFKQGSWGSKVVDEAAIYQHLRWKGMFYLQLRCLKCISMTGSQRLANSLRQAIRPSLSICLCEERHNGEVILLLTQAGFSKGAKTLKF